ncbi:MULTISPECIES: multicopper oxidase domain-containing protein [Thalassospira]|uniref:Copper-containing nitrite reductase n=2 Tax=Thalassospira TaxID=168934 RepID=A0A199YNQ7_9PROT|nr:MULTISPECIES: multicopper oxidase domain-containing protein [Thalassospira]AXO12877.1 copper oxidase [Thalassospira indica]MBR9901039.1 multicopper oxidase domain-containing protein [Rhodospirillales bacterium]OAZ15284.1 copper oxidase [Thalassospira profundimaris]RCK25336.1 copper oxidase [Thalassospira profundimaris]|tara:strand:+ start:2729 stop:3868 length:1140 start_codon:yes stop_codon:yes gene_type:complete
MRRWLPVVLNRRRFLGAGIIATAGATLAARETLGQSDTSQGTKNHDGDRLGSGNMSEMPGHATNHGTMMTVGDVDEVRNGFDTSKLLTDWDTGTISQLPDGRRLRTFEIDAIDKEIEIAPGVMFPAWTYNGRVPGPALRATEGERLRVIFRNYGSHPHSIHFHGIHSARMDGVPGAGVVGPGEEFIYEFDAEPFGCHLYHCHALPLKRHIHKGLYGLFIIDPDPGRHPENTDIARSRLLGTKENNQWQEFAMVMNAFDTNFDDENEVYAVNTVAHAYMKRPIPVRRDRPVRIYLANLVEFDPINSFHLHANFFNYFDHGTTLTPTQLTIDTVMQCQGQRGIIEFSFENHEPGLYMFHAHQSEFAELGWMSFFDVQEARA